MPPVVIKCNSVHADVRSVGVEDLVDDPDLSLLKEDYLKIREDRLKNIAFNANTTYGGTIQIMRKNYHGIFSLQKLLCHTASKLS